VCPIRQSTADVAACGRAERRRTIRVAVVAIENEPGTVESVVVADTHRRSGCGRVVTWTRRSSGGRRSGQQDGVVSADVRTRVRRTVESAKSIALAVDGIVRTVAGIVVADAVGVLAAEVAAGAGVVDARAVSKAAAVDVAR